MMPWSALAITACLVVKVLGSRPPILHDGIDPSSAVDLDNGVVTMGAEVDSMEEGLVANATATIPWSVTTLDSALDRAFEDILVMQHVRFTHEPTNMDPEPANGKQKVAYLFMTKDGLDQHKLWHAWFTDAEPDAFSIYIHQYKFSSDEAKGQRELWEPLGANFIPVVKTGWGQLSGVEYALFWEALRDPLNAQFVLLSEGHVPLKSATYVYDYLMADSLQSKVCFNMPQKSLAVTSSELTRSCTYKDTLKYVELPTKAGPLSGRVRKHHQWVVLARRHAVDVVGYGEPALRQHLRATYRAPYEMGVDPATLGASDEAFVATALLLASEARGKAAKDEEQELRAVGVSWSCTTFVYWRHCWQGTALGAEAGWGSSTWQQARSFASAVRASPLSDWTHARKSPVKVWNDTPRDFGLTTAQPTEGYLRSLVEAGFLFARKLGKDENGELSLDLSGRLPALWQEWEKKFGERTEKKMQKEVNMWPVLDVGDQKAKAAAKKRIPIK
mmetsp:Transcript_98752/g.288061  ORF Transcript_98752/g.288061 Transcript_98752/m.288061 type:complete len:502 (+) Transcript_98752:57-1562(+)